ncbi:MAG TPA: hypothetical protein VLZ83_16170 [Edaphocola sp.]|nr:hypothetical protein [Edaphocola sp.]
MKTTFLILSALLFFAKDKKGNIKELNCNNFKFGKFELINSEENLKYIIERNDEFQTETTYNLKNGKKIKDQKVLKIKWINNCEYNLLLDTAKGTYDNTDLYINSIGGMNTKIIKIENNCFNVITTVEDIAFEARMCKIE